MEMVYFTLAALALYVISDRIVDVIERRRGERLQNRSLLFFVIILVLAVVSFSAIEYLMKNDASGTPEATTTVMPDPS